MSKKLFIVPSLVAILLAAWGGQAPGETVTPASTETPVATASATASATVTLAATETANTSITSAAQPAAPSTPEPPRRPTNSPDCTNHATFVADVTIPDNSEVGAGTTFTKTWRVGNLGTCTWGPEDRKRTRLNS